MSNIGDKMRYNIRDYLTEKEVNKLMDLFDKIKLDLSDSSFPTRTNRLEDYARSIGADLITEISN